MKSLTAKQSKDLEGSCQGSPPINIGLLAGAVGSAFSAPQKWKEKYFVEPTPPRPKINMAGNGNSHHEWVDVFPIEKGNFPASHVSFRECNQKTRWVLW